jgi:hypothetical protein
VNQEVLMLLTCANPNCPAEFLYLYEGEWVVIGLPGQMQRYWLCGACSQSMRVFYEPGKGIKVVPKDMVKKSPEAKPVHAVDPPSKAA